MIYEFSYTKIMLKHRLYSYLPLISCRCVSVKAEGKVSRKKKEQLETTSEFNSSETNDAATTAKKVAKTSGKSDSIEKYFNSREDLSKIKPLIPDEYLRSKRANAMSSLYLADPVVAKQVVKLIKPTLYKEPNILVDSNPGLGLITNELLKSGVKVVRLYENCPKYRKVLKESIEKYPGRIELFNKDIFSLWKLSYQDKIDNFNRVDQLLKGIPTRNWTDDPTLTIIGAAEDLNFIKFMLVSLIMNTDIVLYGRTELYLMMPPKLYLQLVATPKDNYYLYRGSSVLFQVLFDIDHLGTFPRKAYVPWETKRKLKIKEATPTDTENLFLVRINFKKVLPLPTEQLPHFYHFVRQCMSSRRRQVIAHLEKWLPNAGLKLMLLDINKKKKFSFKDLTIFTHFGELTPKQFLNLFSEFMSWPEIADSPFMSSVDDAMLKLTTHPDQVANVHIASESEVADEKKELEQVDIVKKLVNE